MAQRSLEPDSLPHDADWLGNNAAFTCPACSKVFIVSGIIGKGERECPGCGKSRGLVSGGAKSGGSATLRWSPD
jgi:hypothetical protein